MRPGTAKASRCTASRCPSTSARSSTVLPFCDLAIKVVGVGSVGTYCGIALFLAADDDPIFLQIKEAKASVLEPYAGKSVHENHGQRIVAGQRLMQSASDIFLGWTQGLSGRHFYIRQLRDAKISAIVEGFDLDLMQSIREDCVHGPWRGRMPARATPR